MREIRLKERGQNFAFAIFLIAIGAACYFGYIGLEKAAIVTIGVIASAMGLVLYTYRNSNSAENTK
jgi:type IV secretory pathway VirB2 component (pilin)